MNNLPLKPLRWTQRDLNPLAELELTAYSALHEYVITEPKQGKFEIKKTRPADSYKKSEVMTGFTSAKDAQDEAWAHYQRSMQPYVKPDSITDIANWFKAAKPEPTDKDICVQLGCHFEEIVEMLDELKEDEANPIMRDIADYMKTCGGAEVVTLDNSANFLDALCDQIVTATGVAYMMGFDMQGALKEVIRSNNSKMVNGKFEFDKNGKIMKPESYSEPDLTPFIKQGE
ncbi:nucleoside triphosphate pyrophosphohydrolase family protein [Psychrobacter celer]|uniref:nucleoside triphosphate pyrophosphohydrolase family protein n=1 Tax=Psychrobacter celer TaxID=306572 RepID=UPI003FCF5B6D